MTSQWTDEQLRCYLEETGSLDQNRAIEQEVGQSKALQQRLSELVDQQESGLISVGQVWRQERLSCPSQAEWIEYALGVLEAEKQQWMTHHLETTKCPHCNAIFSDIRQQLQEGKRAVQREERLFESSVGHFLSQQGE